MGYPVRTPHPKDHQTICSMCKEKSFPYYWIMCDGVYFGEERLVGSVFRTVFDTLVSALYSEELSNPRIQPSKSLSVTLSHGFVFNSDSKFRYNTLFIIINLFCLNNVKIENTWGMYTEIILYGLIRNWKPCTGDGSRRRSRVETLGFYETYFIYELVRP